jgi:hypothetical protein
LARLPLFTRGVFIAGDDHRQVRTDSMVRKR